MTLFCLYIILFISARHQTLSHPFPPCHPQLSPQPHTPPLSPQPSIASLYSTLCSLSAFGPQVTALRLTPGTLGSYGVQGMEPRFVACKTSALLSVLSLDSILYVLFKSEVNCIIVLISGIHHHILFTLFCLGIMFNCAWD